MIALFLFGLMNDANNQAQPFGASGVDIFTEHTVLNPCSGEAVFFPDGDCHFSIHGVVNPNGIMKTFYHFNFNLVGTGLSSGNTYHCIYPYNEKVHETEVGVEGSFFIVLNLISQAGASGPNLYYTFMAKYTIDAGGNLKWI